MKSNTGHQHTTRDLRELSRSGNGSEREIGGAEFGCAIGLEGEHAAVGRGSQIRRGGIGGRSDELIRSIRIPDSDRTTGSGAEGNKNAIASSRALNKGRASKTGDFRLRSRLNGWRAHHQVHLSEACGTSAGRAAFAAEIDEHGLRAGSGNTSGILIHKSCDTTDKHRCATSHYRVEEI